MDKETETSKQTWSYYLPFIFVILSWIAFWYFSKSCNIGWETKGQFGDTFGTINALFSGLAFAGVIVTILLQREDLQLTQKELKRSTQAQEESANALKEQIKSMRYASMLEGYSSLLNNLNHLVAENKDDISSIKYSRLRDTYAEKIELILHEIYNKIESEELKKSK